MHAYAEMYNNLIRPTKHKVHLSLELAADVIINQVGARLTIIELIKEDYEAAIKRCARLNLVGGVIYDALHLQAALKAGAEILYADNLRDFTRLVIEEGPIRTVRVR
jgi:predicted nucleic acid-binding protein